MKNIKAAIGIGALTLGIAQSSAISINGSVLFKGPAGVLADGAVTTVVGIHSSWSVVTSTGDFATEGLVAGIFGISVTSPTLGPATGLTLVASVVPQWIAVDVGAPSILSTCLR